MNLMEIDRRKALGFVAAAALYPGAALSLGGKTLYLNAMTSTDWAHGAALFDASPGFEATKSKRRHRHFEVRRG